VAGLLAARFERQAPQLQTPPRISDIGMASPRIQAPPILREIFSSQPTDRAGHTYGKAFRDIVRGLRRDFSPAPDLVAFPRDEADIVAVLDWAGAGDVAIIPYGGGSSVCGGVEARLDGAYRAAVSLDLTKLDKVIEIDRRSRAARIQAGIFGPALETALRPAGLTLRHFPQSFEFSTLGGWIATRSGGHNATLYTHIDDFVEALRVVTPAGTLQTRRLPGSGAGPSPDRMFIGSEGTLGVITEAWMRLQDRPRFRASASIGFKDFARGAEAVRQIGQAGLYPSNLRLLDAGEAANSGVGDGRNALLLLAFESAHHELDAWMRAALECCRDNGGSIPDAAGRTKTDTSASRSGTAGAWREAFLRAPYLRDVIVAMGYISETFETAVTWDRFENFHAIILREVGDVLRRVCGTGSLTCRFTHVYPDGPAPYYTILAPSTPGSQLEQWSEIKAAAGEIIDRLGATITHHHAIGRDHRPWYDRQRPDLFARALSAAKGELDSRGILNPGVLIRARG